ncbi:MAG: class I SAM-dependent methyltransferase [Ferrovibrio sp.]|uniref:class I SAM-dependent methyltransferase n=1 Tax=Ferrovibrio sp. TaxID=1917215 RepID=UPI002609A1EB|nr:class I SAM-dependent methyltransferase [Ferrovibrio sp.]MCW0232069.1 class I SAM-dependent methyltransferase [Ferrovibrio sp.]
MDRKQHWDSVYTTRAETEVSWFQDNPALSLALIQNSGIAHDAALIDIGGGASRLADALLAEGYGNLAVLDIAAAALEKSRTRLGEAASRIDWIVADITQWQPTRAYRLWHDRAVFHFLTEPSDRAAYKRALLAGTGAGSQIIIASFAPDGPERCSGLPVTRYSPQSLQTELGADFVLQESRHEEHRTPGGNLQHFQFSRFARL